MNKKLVYYGCTAYFAFLVGCQESNPVQSNTEQAESPVKVASKASSSNVKHEFTYDPTDINGFVKQLTNNPKVVTYADENTIYQDELKTPSTPAPLAKKSTLSHNIGVLIDAAACTSVDPFLYQVHFHFDDEDNRNSNAQMSSGWMANWTNTTDTNMDWCELSESNSLQFTQIRTTSSPGNTDSYAVLLLGDECPNGGYKVKRHFDNEDTGNTNSSSGVITPNVVNGNADLYFCYYPGYLYDGSFTTYRTTKPSLGFAYS
jgi:hypothetical protein